MPWTPLTPGSSSYSGAPVTSRTATCGAVAVGDTINVGVLHDNSSGAVVTDTLGNTYSKNAEVIAGVAVGVWSSRVTVAGTPTVEVQFLPNPGGSTATLCDLNVDPFAGSNAQSAVDGANSNGQGSPGTGTDAVTSGTFATSKDGCLIYGASANTALGVNDAVGTGYTQAQRSSSGALVTEYKTQAVAGSVAATFTSDLGTATATAGHAMSPALILDDSDQTVLMITQRWQPEIPCF